MPLNEWQKENLANTTILFASILIFAVGIGAVVYFISGRGDWIFGYQREVATTPTSPRATITTAATPSTPAPAPRLEQPKEIVDYFCKNYPFFAPPDIDLGNVGNILPYLSTRTREQVTKDDRPYPNIKEWVQLDLVPDSGYEIGKEVLSEQGLTIKVVFKYSEGNQVRSIGFIQENGYWVIDSIQVVN